jgi:hypothetical protein
MTIHRGKATMQLDPRCRPIFIDLVHFSSVLFALGVLYG